ncbi:transposase, partial [Aerococcus urinaeequi]
IKNRIIKRKLLGGNIVYFSLQNYVLLYCKTQQSKLVKLPSGLRRVLRTFTKLQRYIGHTFKYNHLTNGRIEGLNNKIKILKRIAYGYRNFQNFRTRILMTNKLYLNEIPVVEAA